MTCSEKLATHERRHSTSTVELQTPNVAPASRIPGPHDFQHVLLHSYEANISFKSGFAIASPASIP
eukprot:249569-Amphidinium_carterae.1